MRWTEEDLKRFNGRTGAVEAPAARATSAVRPRQLRGPYIDERMNKTEALYALELESRRLAGEIAEWGFEDHKLRLAKRTWYTPDFRVVGVGGETEFHEVKGFWEEDARIKIKVVAEKFRRYRFIALTRLRARDGGGWAIEEF